MASSGKPLGEHQLAIPPEIKIYTPERDARGMNDHVSQGLHDYFFLGGGGHHWDALQGENGLGQWPRPENPWDTHQLTCAPGPKTILLRGMREEHVTTLATGVNVHLGEHVGAGLHDHSYLPRSYSESSCK